jgi:hypothetical protein
LASAVAAASSSVVVAVVAAATTVAAVAATQQLSITISPATLGMSLGVSPTAGNATTLTPVTLTVTIDGVPGGPAPGGTVSFT